MNTPDRCGKRPWSVVFAFGSMLAIVSGVLLLTTVGCEQSPDRPSPEEVERILDGAPEVIRETDSGATLEGLEGIWLGQPQDDALDALAEMCPDTMEYRLQHTAEKAWFRGCEFDRPKGSIHSIRVGFWPSIGNRVATLEVKRDDVGLPVVRERFRKFTGGVRRDMVRSGYLEMRAERYQLLADRDEGKEGPTHITMGFSRSYAERFDE